MRSEFLTKTLTRSYHQPDGCGMSTNPGYYSGRGASSSDLTGQSLEVLYTAIEKNVNKEAADEFAKMVRDIPVLSATDFLITLANFEANNWVWDTKLLSTAKGQHVECVATLFATLMSDSKRDETVSIRASFLRKRGLKEPRPDSGFSRYHGY